MASSKRPPSRAQLKRHANRYDGVTWCDAREDWSREDDGLVVIGEAAPPEDLDAVTCVECLRRIVAYGDRAARQLHVVDIRERDPQQEP